MTDSCGTITRQTKRDQRLSFISSWLPHVNNNLVCNSRDIEVIDIILWTILKKKKNAHEQKPCDLRSFKSQRLDGYLPLKYLFRSNLLTRRKGTQEGSSALLISPHSLPFLSCKLPVGVSCNKATNSANNTNKETQTPNKQREKNSTRQNNPIWFLRPGRLD